MIVPAILFLAASTTFVESYRAGLQALQQNHLNDAQADLESAAKLEPSSAGVWLALAQTYWKLQQPGKADEAADRAVHLAAGDAATLKLLAVFYFETRQWLRAIELNPHEERYYFDFANDLLQKQKFEPALKVLLDAKRNFNKSSQIELALGVAYYGLRRYPEAAAAFQRTTGLSPDVEQPYIFLGKMLDQLPDKLPELTQLFERFEQTHPQNYVGYLLHAKALVAQSLEPEESGVLLKKACSLNGRIAEPHFELGALLQGQHRFAEAAREFERAAELEPSDPAAHYRLAQVYDRLGKSDAATAERERHTRLLVEAARQ